MIGIPWRKHLLESATSVTICSYDEGKAVGVINGMTDQEVTYLADLYIMPEYRRQGRGRRLVAEFMESVHGTTVVLLTSDATGFYKKIGFQERTAMVWRKK